MIGVDEMNSAISRKAWLALIFVKANGGDVMSSLHKSVCHVTENLFCSALGIDDAPSIDERDV